MKKIVSCLFLLVAIYSQAQEWQLVWQDEFNYTGLPDPNKWDYDRGVLNLNAEVQNYAANRLENTRVENGNLIIEARRDWYQGTEYSSGRMHSRRKGDWTYGRIEVKAKVPVGQGIWPAIWMLPTDWAYGGWPESGEIDIMENYSAHGLMPNSSEGNVHTKAYNHSIGTNKGAKIHGLSNVQDNYHVYAVSWYKDRIDFDVDGKIYFTFRNEGGWEKWPYDKRFHLILNIAVGGMLGGNIDPNIFPKRMIIDYVRVYQQEGTGPASTTGLVTAYEDCDYKGFSGGFDVGNYNLDELTKRGINNDVISSFKIKQGYQAILYQDDNFGGGSTVINSDNACLNTTWNNKVSSIKVLPNGINNLGGIYYLQNKKSGHYLDVAGGEAATEDGANIHQWPLTSTKNQQFKFEHLNDGAYKILAQHSGKAIDVAGINKANDANVHQWTYLGSDNQKFIIVPGDEGFFKLVAQHSGRIIEIFKCSTEQQANVQQYDNNNQDCGQWRFIPANAVTGNGTGLRANYFNGNDFNTPVLTRIDGKIDMDWAAGSPDPSINNNDFSARWTGKIQPKYDGEYTFYLDADDGIKLWIDGEVVIENWNTGSKVSTGKKTLKAGQTVNMRIDYFEGGGNAKALFSWSTTLLKKEIVPKSQLYPNNLPTVSITSPVNNSTFDMPSEVVITANATDEGGNINKIQFYNGNTLLGEDNTPPYNYIWNSIPEGSYSISARAYDSQEAVKTSSTTDFVVSNVTGGESYFENEDVKFYPNPVQNTLYVNHGEATITIYDLTGKPILTNAAAENGIDVSNLTSGLYTVEIKTVDKIIVEKLIKE